MMTNVQQSYDHQTYEQPVYDRPGYVDIPEDKVVKYLARHPEFFLQHGDLLSKLKIPHKQGMAVSLVERQVTVLRNENQKLQHKLDNLVDLAKRNEQLYGRIQELILRLAGITQITVFLDTLYGILSEEFRTDVVTARLFEVAPSVAGRPEFTEYDAQVFALFRNVLESGKPVCGRLTLEQQAYLFPTGRVGSAMLIPLTAPQPNGGLLALGSRDVGRFHTGMSTDLMAHMGQLTSRLLDVCLTRH